MLRIAVAILFALGVAGAPLSAQQQPSLPSALAELRAQDARVLTLGYRLVTGNARYCSDTTFTAGLLLHDMAPYEDGSSSCDSGSDTTCGGAPVFQRDGADGPVLHRRVSESTDNQGFHTVRYYWIVADSSALTNCGNGLHGSFATASGGAYPDDAVERGWSEMEPRNWRDGGWRESHRNSDMAFVANSGGH